VRFSAHGHKLCTSHVAGGEASCVARIDLKRGRHRIAGRYSGDAAYLPSSASFSLRVKKPAR
jgi:hypothetical protein